MGIKCDNSKVEIDTNSSGTTYLVRIEAHGFLTAAQWAQSKVYAASSQAEFDTYLSDSERLGSWYAGLPSATKANLRTSFLSL